MTPHRILLVAAMAIAVSNQVVAGFCTNTCTYSTDGGCDDGGRGSEFSSCDIGTDCIDCGTRAALCSNTCSYASDGVCDEGGPGSQYSVCVLGSDCFDCNQRIGRIPTSSALAASASIPGSPPDWDLAAASDVQAAREHDAHALRRLFWGSYSPPSPPRPPKPPPRPPPPRPPPPRPPRHGSPRRGRPRHGRPRRHHQICAVKIAPAALAGSASHAHAGRHAAAYRAGGCVMPSAAGHSPCPTLAGAQTTAALTGSCALMYAPSVFTFPRLRLHRRRPPGRRPHILLA